MKGYLSERQANTSLSDKLSKLAEMKSKVDEILIIGWSFGASDQYFKSVVQSITPRYPEKAHMQYKDIESMSTTNIYVYSREEDWNTSLDAFKRKFMYLLI